MFGEPLVEDEAWSNFESGLNNEKSKTVYTRNVNEFMRFFDLHSYDELVKAHVKDIQEMLKIWIKSHKDAGLKGNTINVKLSAVELLLDMNEIVWARKKIRKMVPRSDHETGGRRPITTDEIQMLLKATNDFRMIAIIHFLASTGGRPAVLTDPPLKFKHLHKMTDDTYAIKISNFNKTNTRKPITRRANQQSQKKRSRNISVQYQMKPSIYPARKCTLVWQWMDFFFF